MPLRLLRILFIVLLAFCINSNAIADDADRDALRSEFQKVYSTAANASSLNDLTGASDSSAVRQYSLYPYLQLIRLQRALVTPSQLSEVDAAAERFIKEHEGEFVANELRRSWYPSLTQRREWERFLSTYKDINDPSIRCYALSARVALQRIENLESQIESTWSTAPDSRPACEPAFEWLKQRGALTTGLIEARVRVALLAGNAAFARQIIALLPKESAERYLTWAALIEKPRSTIDMAIANPQLQIDSAVLLDGWSRLVRTDTDGAMQRLEQLKRSRQLPTDIAARCALEIALVLSWNRRPEALKYFALVPTAQLDDRGFEWSARAALWAGDWKRASKTIESMPRTLQQQTKWRYWLARANERLGKRNTALAQYNELLHDDNYYAALAAARLNTRYTPQPKALSVNEDQLKALALQPAFDRAHELLLTTSPELRRFAYDEWRDGYSRLSASDRQVAVVLANHWNWYDQAILTAAQQSFFSDYELLYPRPYDSYVKAAAEKSHLPVELIYATLRQESLYRIDAQSAAGAIGLMQLMPEPSRRTPARGSDSSGQIDPTKDPLNAATNISRGTAKLNSFREMFAGRVALALAAYNAGPGAVKRWLPPVNKDIDVWVENIPYNETRVYVQRVMWHSVVFGWLLSGKAQMTSGWLAEVKAGM